MSAATNTELAKLMAAFADVLAQYDHLPAMDIAQVSISGRVHACVRDARAVAVWADAFGREVVLAESPAGFEQASATLTVSGWTVLFSEHLPVALAGPVRKALRRAGFDGRRVPAGELLAAIVGCQAVAS